MTKLFDKILSFLKWLTIVEIFKWVSTSLFKTQNTNIAKAIYILIKWFTIVIFTFYSCIGKSYSIIVWYLIVSNLFTYFYHHIWTIEATESKQFNIDRQKKRFVYLIQAFSFNIFAFAYLYFAHYANHYNWTTSNKTFLNSIWFSISNSLAANYDLVKPNTNDEKGYTITMIQLVITFIFVTIIFSRSIPEKNNE